MATVKPFQAIRPEKEVVSRVAALPYDVYQRGEAREVAKKEPLSFLNIDRPETQFPEEYDMYAKEVYDNAASMLHNEIQQGIFHKDAQPYYYIYELTMEGRSQTGLVACASIDDYCNQIIKKHENTREEKELDRIHHVDTLSTQTGPIFLAYRRREALETLILTEKQKPVEYDFVSEDGIRHRVWVISDLSVINQIAAEFDQVNQIYIADGHHRAASAVKVGLKRRNEAVYYTGQEEFNYFLSVLFPENELKILPYYRVVKDLNHHTKEDFIELIKQAFSIEESAVPVAPTKKGEFGMYLDSVWYRLTVKEELARVTNPVEALDVSLLQKYLLSPILGIDDPRTDTRIDFVGGIRGLQELERRAKQDMKIAFSTYPTSISELFSVSDAGLLMPPKSTWFEPKLRSGIFLHEF